MIVNGVIFGPMYIILLFASFRQFPNVCKSFGQKGNVGVFVLDLKIVSLGP